MDDLWQEKEMAIDQLRCAAETVASQGETNVNALGMGIGWRGNGNTIYFNESVGGMHK